MQPVEIIITQHDGNLAQQGNCQCSSCDKHCSKVDEGSDDMRPQLAEDIYGD